MTGACEPWRPRWLGAALLLSLVWPAAAQEQRVALHGWGAEGCGRFLEVQRGSDEFSEATLRQWVLGYLSAYNTFTAPDGDATGGADAATIMALVEQKCVAYPRLTIAAAVARMAREEEARR